MTINIKNRELKIPRIGSSGSGSCQLAILDRKGETETISADFVSRERIVFTADTRAAAKGAKQR